MSDLKNDLFPLILDILSHKPLLCETQDNLLKDIGKQLGNAKLKKNDLEKHLRSTIDMGTSLGILSVRDEEVRMPFLLKSSSPTTRTIYKRNKKPVTSGVRTKLKSRNLSYKSQSRRGDAKKIKLTAGRAKKSTKSSRFN